MKCSNPECSKETPLGKRGRPRYYCSEECKSKTVSKKHYYKHREQLLVKARKRRQSRTKQQQLSSAEYQLFYRLDKSGWTIEYYNQKVTEQKNRCAICGRTPEEVGSFHKRLCTDHNHNTDKPRGLLCHPCNLALGYLQDNPEFLDKGADYLRSYQ